MCVPLDEGPRGYERRVRVNLLPRVVLAYDRALSIMVGAFLLSACDVVSGKQYWTVDKFLALERAVPVGIGDRRYLAQTFDLVPEFEQRVRQTVVENGQVLNHCFAAFASTVWRAWSCDSEVLAILRRHNGIPVVISVALGYSRSMMVQPEQSSTVPNPGADLEESAQLVGIEPGASTDSGPLLPQPSIMQQLFSFMTSHFKPRGGACEVTYSVECMLSPLVFAHKLKPGVTVPDALSSAASLLHGSSVGVDLRAAFANKTCALQMVCTMRAARLKLDLLSVRWQSFLSDSFCYRRSLCMTHLSS